MHGLKKFFRRVGNNCARSSDAASGWRESSAMFWSTVLVPGVMAWSVLEQVLVVEGGCFFVRLYTFLILLTLYTSHVYVPGTGTAVYMYVPVPVIPVPVPYVFPKYVFRMASRFCC